MTSLVEKPPHLSSTDVYSPLKESGTPFRLLSIFPGQRDDPLECTLQQAELDHPPEYETVSYCWGDPANTDSAIVDGTTVSLPATSVAVLRRIRQTDSKRLVWIDAVCINQGDMHERNRQVLMMGGLYTKGKQNLIYLGEDNMTEAFQNVKDICGDPETEDILSLWRDDDSEWPFSTRKTIRAQYSDAALTALFSNDWFWRAWTWQEALLSKSSICFGGSAQIPLSDIATAVIVINYNIMFVSRSTGPAAIRLFRLADLLDPVAGFKFRGPDGRTADMHMGAMSERKCSHPVDRIYAILGLCPDLNITPDYSKPMVEVFEEAFRAIIAQARKLTMLASARPSSLHISTTNQHAKSIPFANSEPSSQVYDIERPSWLPAWHRAASTLDDTAFRGFPVSFNASNGRLYEPPPAADEKEESGILRLSGFKLGSVIGYDSWTRSNRNTDWPSLLSEVDKLATEAMSMRDGFDTTAQSEISAVQELETATVLNVGQASVDGSKNAKLLNDYRAFRKITDAGRAKDIPWPHEVNDQTYTDLARSADDTSEEDWAGATTFQAGLLGLVAVRRVFITSIGHLCLGPEFIEKGDVVVVLNGYDYPAVLRPSGKHYMYLGNAYVDGLMYGGAVEEHESNGGRDEIFELC